MRNSIAGICVLPKQAIYKVLIKAHPDYAYQLKKPNYAGSGHLALPNAQTTDLAGAAMKNCEEWQSLCKQCRDAQMQALSALMEFKDQVDAYLQNGEDKPTYEEYDRLRIYLEYEQSARARLMEFVLAHELVTLND